MVAMDHPLQIEATVEDQEDHHPWECTTTIIEEGHHNEATVVAAMDGVVVDEGEVATMVEEVVAGVVIVEVTAVVADGNGMDLVDRQDMIAVEIEVEAGEDRFKVGWPEGNQVTHKVLCSNY